MAIPPKGDPRRPLHLAIRSIRTLAMLFLLFGACGIMPIFLWPRRRGGTLIFANVALVFPALFYTGSGIAYLVFAIYLKQRRFWAVVAALVLASIHCLFALIACIVGLIVILSNNIPPPGFIAIGVAGLIVLALAELIYHLARSFEAIRHVPIDEQRGFEPLMMPPPIIPVFPLDRPDENKPG